MIILLCKSSVVRSLYCCIVVVAVLYVRQDMPKELQPQFILDVEKEELFINAGLQDRVIQVRCLLYVV